MADVYTTYEAKAKLSEILRRVRRGKRVVVTHRGEPVAEIGPIAPPAGLDERLRALSESGELVRAALGTVDLKPVVVRPGALARFLAEREA